MNRLVFESRDFTTSYNTRSTDVYKQQLFPASTTCVSALQTRSFCSRAPRPSGCPVYPHTCPKRCQAAKSKPLSHLQHPRAPRPTHTGPSHLKLQPESVQEGASRAWGRLILSHPLQPLRARALEGGKHRYEEG